MIHSAIQQTVHNLLYFTLSIPPVELITIFVGEVYLFTKHHTVQLG